MLLGQPQRPYTVGQQRLGNGLTAASEYSFAIHFNFELIVAIHPMILNPHAPMRKTKKFLSRKHESMKTRKRNK
jgi:hypothetical protein